MCEAFPENRFEDAKGSGGSPQLNAHGRLESAASMDLLDVTVPRRSSNPCEASCCNSSTATYQVARFPFSADSLLLASRIPYASLLSGNGQWDL